MYVDVKVISAMCKSLISTMCIAYAIGREVNIKKLYCHWNAAIARLILTL